jgi:hypothetical protein
MKMAVVGTALLGLGIGAGFGASAAFGTAPANPVVRHTASEVAGVPPAATAAAASLTSPSELKYVGVAPCILVDTRKTGGVFGNGTSRNYNARGNGSLAGQGGSSTGCGIEKNAGVIVVNVGALSPVAPGFIKAKAFNAPGAGEGAVNYEAHQSIGGVLNLNLSAPGAAKAFTLTNTGGPTGVVVTVTGYYIAPMAARVATNATIVSSSRVVSVTHPFLGTYIVTFDRDVSDCVTNATSYDQINRSFIAQDVGGGPAEVAVDAYNSATGASVDASFNLTVTC